jgi:predicted RNA-binding protein with PUA-like domain
MWLLKTEPSDYSYDDLEREGRTVWDGVSNPAALRNLGAMRAGERVVIYHTGDEKAGVGLAEVVRAAYPDPRWPAGKRLVVDLKAVERLPRPVTLAEIKADPSFNSFALVRISRLSVMPVTDDEWRRIEQKARESRRT